MSSSPERGSFRIDNILKQVEAGEKTLEKAEEEIEFYKSWDQQKKEREAEPEWKIDNLEYDLRTTEWIIEKVKSDEVYAQNLYAALCNNDFTRNDVWPILTSKTWHCSWRYAGGIIADMRQEGDYIDWYCSGIRGDDDWDDDQFRQATKEQQEFYLQRKAYVGESVVTDEIRQDLFKLGWLVADDNNEDTI